MSTEGEQTSSAAHSITPESLRALSEIIRDALPKWVPAFASIKLGLFVTALIAVVAVICGMADKAQNKDNDDVFERYRWMAVITIGVILALKIGDFVQEKHYTFRCIATNRQHYANIHWLRLYKQALTA